MIWQFAYVHDLYEFHYSQRKKQDATIQFSLLKQHKTLISKTTIFISCAQNSQWATKRVKNFRTKPQKSIIKNCNNIISDWVIIQIKYH